MSTVYQPSSDVLRNVKDMLFNFKNYEMSMGNYSFTYKGL